MLNSKEYTREVGYMEKVLSAYNPLSILTISQIIGEISDIQNFQKAVNLTIDKNPNLCVFISGNQIQRLPQNSQYTIPNVIDSQADEWKQIADKLTNEKQDNLCSGTSGFFQVTLVRNQSQNDNYLMVKTHHSLADGISGMIITNDILKFYSQLVQNKEVILQSLDFLPSIENIIFPNKQFNENQQKQIQYLQQYYTDRRSQYKQIIPLDCKENTSQRNLAIYKDGSIEGFNIIKQKCKQNQVTVGSLLLSLIYFSVSKLTQNENLKFQFDLDVNLRKRGPWNLGDNNVGFLIGMICLDIKLDGQTKFWDLVKQINQQLKDRLETQDHLLYHEVNKRMDDPNDPNYQINFVKNTQRCNDLNFSNIGQYPFNSVYQLNQQNQLKINKFYCIGSQWSPCFGEYVILINSVEFISFCMTYQESQKYKETAIKWLDIVVDLLEFVSKQAENDITISEFL